MTVAKSPVTGESTKEAVKTIARGCRAFSGVTVVTNARVYYHYTRGCGRIGRPASLRPLIGGQGNLIANLGRIEPRDREAVSAVVVPAVVLRF
jgi:hypothetical protein